jgi:hypothetical protein
MISSAYHEMIVYKIWTFVIDIIVHDKQIHVDHYNLYVNIMGQRTQDTPKQSSQVSRGRQMRLSSHDGSMFQDTIQPNNSDVSPCRPYIRILTT